MVLGLPATLVQPKTDAQGNSATRNTGYAYDATTGALQTETIEPGVSQYQIVTSYDRSGNPFGLVNKKTQTWFDPASRINLTRTLVDTTYDGNLSGTDAEKDATMQNIGLDLARAHVVAVDIDLRDKIGVPGLLNPNQVATYHWDVFSKYGVSPNMFGGTLGGLPASSYPVTWCEGCDGNKK